MKNKVRAKRHGTDMPQFVTQRNNVDEFKWLSGYDYVMYFPIIPKYDLNKRNFNIEFWQDRYEKTGKTKIIYCKNHEEIIANEYVYVGSEPR